ncbi:MAG: hypothetical protein COA50_05490 [Flavobacteriaceae bacterium]|nr:MAG: hypothetical protein COA50_05490 [Flavobacteriaceae bacterium]
MKYLIYFLVVILSSCGPEAEMFQRQYVIENNSSVPIELQFYRDGELNLGFATSQLQNGERLEGLILDRSGGAWSELTSEELVDRPSASFESDSVRVLFNNQKLMIYQISFVPLMFTPSDRNLLKDNDYSVLGGDKFLFEISESDFDNAADCSGDCN